MDDDTETIGSPITLAELKALGEFVRWQDVGTRVADLIKADGLPNGYPIVPSRLPANGLIDLFINNRWKQVRFLRIEGTPLGGNRRIVYADEEAEEAIRYDRYRVAPAGCFTEWQGARPETLAGARLTDEFEPAQQDHVIHSQTVTNEDWPYLTFEVTSFHPNARWVERDDMWTASYTVHVADPRVIVEGVVSREPWFNTTIAISHRWLDPNHPDPNGKLYDELMILCETLGLHDNQAFLIDYCSLPQQPRSPEETAWFHEQLPGFQTQFKYVTVVLNTGSADYSSRAWCMFELMLAAMSRAQRPTLLNHDRLEKPLQDARDLAATYLKHAGWNQQEMLRAFRHGISNKSFAQWAANPANVGLYNAAIDGKRDILEKFENELAVTDPNDRPIIIDLLKRLAFDEMDA